MIELSFISKHTNQKQIVEVEVPKNFKQVLILLHPLGQTPKVFSEQLDIKALAQEKDAIIIMPSGERNFFTLTEGKKDYPSYIHHEVIDYVDNLLPVDIKSLPRIIGGISMGAYGALNQVLSYPTTYQECILISGSLDIKKRDQEKRKDSQVAPEWTRLMGDSFDEQKDLLTKNYPNIKYYLAIGEEDYLKESNEKVVAILEANNLDYEYHTSPGKHEAKFFYPQLEKAIKQI